MAVAIRRAYGRRSVSDLRDLQFLLVDADPITCATPPTKRTRCVRGPVYDQGDAPYNVACALLAALHAAPVPIRGAGVPEVVDFDHQIREFDGSLGLSNTVSLRSGCRMLKKLGLIAGYYWAYDLDEIINFLGSGQGLVLGIDWYQAMNRPDEDGLIRAWGRPEGGHAVFAFGVDPESRTVWIQNSWGADWGGWSARPNRHDFKGCARLPYDDLRKLMVDNGEAVALAKRSR